MNLQLKFIVLAFSAFTLVNAASSAPIDDELAAAASNVLRERKIAEVDDKHMSDLKKELGDVAESACKVGLDGFAREFKRGFNYVFSNENVEQASCFLTRVHDEVPVKFLVGAGLLVADSMLTGFFLENPAQAVVVSGFAFYAYMKLAKNLPDVSYYTDYLSKTASNFVTNSVSAGLSSIFGRK